MSEKLSLHILNSNEEIQVDSGISFQVVAETFLTKQAKTFIGAIFNDEYRDLLRTIDRPGTVQFIDYQHEDSAEFYRHSAAHVLAQAVSRLFPKAKYSIGPVIKDGFYYDFEIEPAFTDEDLPKIEAEMNKIIAADYPIIRREIAYEEAIQMFKDREDRFKVEIIQDLYNKSKETIFSVYSQAEFVDLCRGPHVPSTGYVRSVKLMNVAGAYWRGDPERGTLCRIYGTAWETPKLLKTYLHKLEEAKKRDHRRIGKDLDLFSFHEEGPGFPFWHDRGMKMMNALMDFMRMENSKLSYKEVKTPVLLNDSLWHRSGHYANFKNNMYFTKIDETDFAVKPMNCPGCLLIYKTFRHSYRELPLKIAEFGLCHRHELSGVLHGLFRVRSFTQDDAHVFCAKDQLQGQIQEMIDLLFRVYKVFGFEEVTVFVATRPEKSLGSDEDWEMATRILTESLQSLEISFKIKEGEGAFYGPKIEFNVLDTLERHWQCGTIQVDFSMPSRFEADYEGADGQKHTPVMVHRAILGSFERFIGILIEQFAGKFPLWLSPVQAIVLPVSEQFEEYAQKVHDKLKEASIRTDIDLRSETLGKKIRAAQLERIPYMIIVGEKEVQDNILSVRNRDTNETSTFTIDNLIDSLLNEVMEKRLPLSFINEKDKITA